MRLTREIKLTAAALVLMLVVMPFDSAILSYVNAHADCKPIFQLITEAGRSHWYLVPGGVVMIVGYALSRLGIPARARWPRPSHLAVMTWQFFTLLFFSVASSGIVVNILKPIFARARPREWVRSDTDGFFHWPQILAGKLSDYNSFPSGHAATALSAAVAIILCLPARYRWLQIPLLSAGILIAASRVMVSAHYTSDVVAGAIIGVWAAVLCKNYLERARWAAAISRPDTLQ